MITPILTRYQEESCCRHCIFTGWIGPLNHWDTCSFPNRLRCGSVTSRLTWTVHSILVQNMRALVWTVTILKGRTVFCCFQIETFHIYHVLGLVCLLLWLWHLLVFDIESMWSKEWATQAVILAHGSLLSIRDLTDHINKWFYVLHLQFAVHELAHGPVFRLRSTSPLYGIIGWWLVVLRLTSI